MSRFEDFYEEEEASGAVKTNSRTYRYDIEEVEDDEDSLSPAEFESGTGGGGGYEGSRHGEESRGGGAIGTVMRRSAHPFVVLFHLGFKLASVAAYLLLGIFQRSFVIHFVVTTVLLAMDFWFTKNVSGRLLVGLRWWTDVQENGKTIWRFECIDDTRVVNNFDSHMFWWIMYLFPLAWIGLGVLCMLRFNWKWLTLVGLALVLSGTNLVGYFKCSRQQQDQMRDFVTTSIVNRTLRQFTGA